MASRVNNKYKGAHFPFKVGSYRPCVELSIINFYAHFIQTLWYIDVTYSLNIHRKVLCMYSMLCFADDNKITSWQSLQYFSPERCFFWFLDTYIKDDEKNSKFYVTSIATGFEHLFSGLQNSCLVARNLSVIYRQNI